MNKIGIIGCGSMGCMLLDRFLLAGVINAAQVIVSTLFQDRERLLEIKKKYSEIEIPRDNKELARRSKRIFICVRPFEVKEVLEEIVNCLSNNVHLISIAASVSISNIERIFPGKISRVVPSITLKLDNGISLVCHNENVQKKDAQYLENLLKAISTVKAINEADIEVATNLTSTAPGLIAAIFREFVEAGIRYGNFTREEVEEMVIETFYGTSKLFHEKLMKFPETVSRVATKGGITEVGDALLREKLPDIFDQMFARTLGKFEQIKTEVTNQFAQLQGSSKNG
jgi:pyrroline-5-carboxylate reductase